MTILVSEQPQLMVDPADLLCLMDLVLGAEMPDEERGGGIMKTHIPADCHMIDIGIAVAAQVPAGVVLADVVCQVAGAFLPVPGIGRQDQVFTDGLLKGGLGDAAGAVRADGGEAGILAAGLDSHTVPVRDPDQAFRQCQLGLEGDRAGFREVLPDLFIEVNVTDDAGSCGALQSQAHVGEGVDMALHRPAFVDQNGVIAPAHVVGTDDLRQPLEAVEDPGLIRHIGFDVPAVGCDGHKPVLAVFHQEFFVPEQVSVLQGRFRIFRAENDQVYDGRIEPVFRDRDLVKGVARHDHPLAESVCKPLRIEGRYIGSVAGLNDHKWSPMYRLEPSQVVPVLPLCYTGNDTQQIFVILIFFQCEYKLIMDQQEKGGNHARISSGSSGRAGLQRLRLLYVYLLLFTGIRFFDRGDRADAADSVPAGYDGRRGSAVSLVHRLRHPSGRLPPAQRDTEPGL